MKYAFLFQKLEPNSRKVIQQANDILEEYNRQGFVLTLRQLYYQFVSRDLIPNNLKAYKRLGDIVGKGRLCGLIDWDYLEDRTRNLMALEHFSGPQDALDMLQRRYHIDMWGKQCWRPEVWIEKDALVGVIERVCSENDVPFFSCRGYTSLSEMYQASLRIRSYAAHGYKPLVIHFGDHDPSGIDMSRDIIDRISKTFMADFKFKRVALTMEQIEEYEPPPNPAKVTDSRYEAYVEEFGEQSWELDALEPIQFRNLIQAEIDKVRDKVQWERDVQEREQVRAKLKELAENWNKPKARKKRTTKKPKKKPGK